MRDANGEFVFLSALVFGLYQAGMVATQKGNAGDIFKAFAVGALTAGLGGPSAIAKSMANQGISMSAMVVSNATGINFGKLLSYAQTAGNWASIGITGWNLASKGLNAVGNQSASDPGINNAPVQKLDMGKNLSAAVAMRAFTPMLNSIDVFGGSFKSNFKAIGNAYKDALDFRTPRYTKHGPPTKESQTFGWENLGNMLMHAMASYLYYNAASGGAKMDWTAGGQTMFDCYGMFESTFEYSEKWSLNDLVADLVGTGFGMAVGGSFNIPTFWGNIPIGAGGGASRFANWLY